MATGGSMAHKVGEAYVDLFLRDAKYYQGLLRAQAALTRFGQHGGIAASKLNLNPAVQSAGKFVGVVNQLNRSLGQTESLLRRINRLAAATRWPRGAGGGVGGGMFGGWFGGTRITRNAAPMDPALAAAKAAAIQQQAASKIWANQVKTVHQAAAIQRQSAARAAATAVKAAAQAAAIQTTAAARAQAIVARAYVSTPAQMAVANARADAIKYAASFKGMFGSALVGSIFGGRGGGLGGIGAGTPGYAAQAVGGGVNLVAAALRPLGGAIKGGLAGAGIGSFAGPAGIAGGGMLGAGVGFIKGIDSAASSAVRGVLGLARGFWNLGRSIVGLPFRLLTSLPGLLGLGGAGMLAYKAAGVAMDTERAQMDLARILGGDRGASGRLGGQIRSMASYMPGVPMEKLYDVARLGAKLGIEDPAALRTFTRDMAKFGAILDESDIPLEEATERIASLMTIFDTGTGSADKFASAVLRLDAASVASARDILDVANRFSGPAAVFGMKPADALALATALRQAKVPVETAGTAIGQIFMRMASTKDMPAFAKLAGMDRKSFAASLQDNPLDIIGAISRNIAGMDPIAASRALDDLHLDGQRVRSTMIQLAQVFPLLNKYVGIANDEWREAGMLNKGYAAASETTYAQLQLMQNQFKLLAVELGTAMLPAIKGVAEGFGNLASDFKDLAGRNGPALAAWGESMRRTFEGIGLLWRNPKLVGNQAWLWLTEKAEQAGEVIKRVFTGVVSYLGDLARQIVQAIEPMFRNMIRRGIIAPMWQVLQTSPWLQRLMPGAAGVMQDMLHPRNPGELILDRTGFAIGATEMVPPVVSNPGMLGRAGWFANLPNKDAEQAKAAAEVAAAVAKQQEARGGRRGLDEIKAQALSLLGRIGWIGGGAAGVGGGMGPAPPIPEDIAAVAGGGGGGGGWIGGGVMGAGAGQGGPMPVANAAAVASRARGRTRRAVELWRLGGGFGMGPQLPGPAKPPPPVNRAALAGMMFGQAFGPQAAMLGMQAGADLTEPIKNRGGFEAAGPFSAFMRAQRIGRNRAYLGSREAFNAAFKARGRGFNAFMADPIARNAALFGAPPPGGGGKPAGQKPEEKAVTLLEAIRDGIKALVNLGGAGARFAGG